MSDLYTMLRVSPRKKRVYNSDDEGDVLSPKKLRAMARTPPATPRKRPSAASLPEHLARFRSLQSSLHHALSHSLATAAVCPSSETGIVPNVLNNHILTSSLGLSRTCTLDDIKRLCWLWEWDGKSLPSGEEDDNPFLDKVDKKSEEHPKQWKRGGNGLVITPTTYLQKSGGKRVPAYGIGIEVEMDIDKQMTGGMAAVARWTADGDQRMKVLTKNLHRWVELHSKAAKVPNIPLADLPPIIQAAPKQSSLTRRLASLSPKSPKPAAISSRTNAPLECPPSPTRSTPAKPRVIAGKSTPREFAVPFPITPKSLPRQKAQAKHSDIPFPQTPSTSRLSGKAPVTPSTPRTPAISDASGHSRPVTPVHQTGSKAATAPETPSTSRRAALYDRIRKKSESQVPATPSRTRITSSTSMSRDQLMKLGQEEMRRRCLLGRLSGVAESIWMFFTSPTNTTSLTATPRKRRSQPSDEVAQAVVKSSPVPISIAEAHESIDLLVSICPFFLKKTDVGSEEWLEMPASSVTTGSSQSQVSAPVSPGRRIGGANNSDEEIKSLSPKRVKRDTGGLRQVRERIKRELEASD